MALRSEAKHLTIDVAGAVGEFAITQEDGQQIYDLIHPVLREGRVVVVDFTGIRVLASPFLNMAIGQLLEDIPYDRVDRLLVKKGLSQHDTGLLERVMVNAREYYESPDARRAIDTAIANAAEES